MINIPVHESCGTSPAIQTMRRIRTFNLTCREELFEAQVENVRRARGLFEGIEQLGRSISNRPGIVAYRLSVWEDYRYVEVRDLYHLMDILRNNPKWVFCKYDSPFHAIQYIGFTEMES